MLNFKTNEPSKNVYVGKNRAESDMIQCYFAEIRRYKLLTREEEIELGRRIQNNDDQIAKHKLVNANLRLVVKIALSYKRAWWGGWPLLDLIQEGNVGLVLAAGKFDPDKNVRFAGYASFWIKAYIVKFIMNNWSFVKIGNTKAHRKLFFNLKKEKQKLVEMGLDPQSKLVSERMGVPEHEVIYMDQQLNGRDTSLNSPIEEGSNAEKIERLYADNLSPEARISQKEIETLVQKNAAAFKQALAPRDADIFESRIYSENPDSLQSIGTRYDISRERVRQVEANILKKARDFFIKDKDLGDSNLFREDLSLSAV